MNKLNIFIDESGSKSPFGTNISDTCLFSDKYYIITLVFAYDGDQKITNTINRIRALKEKYNITEAIHFGPLIRREDEFYKKFTKSQVFDMFANTADIIYRSNIRYTTIVLDKTKIKNANEFNDYFIHNFDNVYYNNSFFRNIEEIKVYYDGGQNCVEKFIKNGIYKHFLKHDDTAFNKKPNDYALLQLADYLCTIKLIDIKRINNKTTTNEKSVFCERKKYKKYIKNKILVKNM